jgi:hypothetical protein
MAAGSVDRSQEVRILSSKKARPSFLIDDSEDEEIEDMHQSKHLRPTTVCNSSTVVLDHIHTPTVRSIMGLYLLMTY